MSACLCNKVVTIEKRPFLLCSLKMSFFHRGGGKNTSLDQARSQEKGRPCDVLALDVSTELGVDSPPCKCFVC